MVMEMAGDHAGFADFGDMPLPTPSILPGLAFDFSLPVTAANTDLSMRMPHGNDEWLSSADFAIEDIHSSGFA